jgi:hypothetical protein
LLFQKLQKMNQQQYQQYNQQALLNAQASGSKTDSPLIIKLREQLLGRGVAGIKGIGRMWTQLDDDQSRQLEFREFKDGLINHNVSFTNDEITALYREFDTDGNCKKI